MSHEQDREPAPAVLDRLHAMPKVEIHVHLEGATGPDTIWDMARRNGIELPAQSREEWRAFYEFSDFEHFIGADHNQFVRFQILNHISRRRRLEVSRKIAEGDDLKFESGWVFRVVDKSLPHLTIDNAVNSDIDAPDVSEGPVQDHPVFPCQSKFIHNCRHFPFAGGNTASVSFLTAQFMISWLRFRLS